MGEPKIVIFAPKTVEKRFDETVERLKIEILRIEEALEAHSAEQIRLDDQISALEKQIRLLHLALAANASRAERLQGLKAVLGEHLEAS